ncbi:alpha/beta fold hydrolase [Nonomuraea polychroma]|uniref:alpha/beta fold hydrolase n=1 Tax=Nonomuraea polychroma TaxID=46176 RepID=UPI003D8C5D77
MILLHSTVCDRRMWDPQLPALVDAGYRVVRCDLRGFGETPMPDRPYDNAQDVTDLMDLLGVQQAALVGASGGGQVALEIAARWPQRVTALVLLAAAWAGHEPSADLRAFGEREDVLIEAGDMAGATELNVHTWLGPHADEATREKTRQMQRHAFDVQLAAVEEVEPINVEADLAAITAPSLLISGRHDLADFRWIAAQLSDQLADARHLELAWAGHLPSLERPDALNPVLIDFLHEAHTAR